MSSWYLIIQHSIQLIILCIRLDAGFFNFPTEYSCYFPENRLKLIHMKSRTTRKCLRIRTSTTKMSSTTRWTRQVLTIRNATLQCQLQRRTSIQMNHTTVTRKTFIQRLRLDQIKNTFTRRKRTKRRTTFTGRQDRRFPAQSTRLQYTSATLATRGMCIIHLVAFRCIQATRIFHLISREVSIPICTRRKRQTQPTRPSNRRMDANICHTIDTCRSRASQPTTNIINTRHRPRAPQIMAARMNMSRF